MSIIPGSREANETAPYEMPYYACLNFREASSLKYEAKITGDISWWSLKA